MRKVFEDSPIDEKNAEIEDFIILINGKEVETPLLADDDKGVVIVKEGNEVRRVFGNVEIKNRGEATEKEEEKPKSGNGRRKKKKKDE